MLTILDTLFNARVNLSMPYASVQNIGLKGLNNAITLLQKGYPADFLIGEITDLYDNLENAPTYTEYLEKSNA